MQKSGGKACEAEGTASTASRWWKPAGRTSGTAGLEGHEWGGQKGQECGNRAWLECVRRARHCKDSGFYSEWDVKTTGSPVRRLCGPNSVKEWWWLQPGWRSGVSKNGQICSVLSKDSQQHCMWGTWGTPKNFALNGQWDAIAMTERGGTFRATEREYSKCFEENMGIWGSRFICLLSRQKGQVGSWICGLRSGERVLEIYV